MPALASILYVEDEPDIREIARLALETLGGFSVEICPSGMAALEYIAHDVPDLIVLDVMMPEMDGPSTLKAIRQLPQAKKIPVIFMTAKVQAHEIEGYIAMGAAGVISKPFDAMTLPDDIRAFWDKYHE